MVYIYIDEWSEYYTAVQFMTRAYRTVIDIDYNNICNLNNGLIIIHIYIYVLYLYII